MGFVSLFLCQQWTMYRTRPCCLHHHVRVCALVCTHAHSQEHANYFSTFPVLLMHRMTSWVMTKSLDSLMCSLTAPSLTLVTLYTMNYDPKLLPVLDTKHCNNPSQFRYIHTRHTQTSWSHTVLGSLNILQNSFCKKKENLELYPSYTYLLDIFSHLSLPH